jgi:hypothetical protein
MPFRYRRSARLGPLRFNFGKSGLSSISLGGRGASFNIPVARSGAPRTTVGLPNSRRLRPGQLDAFKQGCLGVLQEQLIAPRSEAQWLWELNLITRLLADPSIGSRTQGLLAVIETPEAMEAYVMRAQSQDDVKRRAHRCVEAVQEAARLANVRGWIKA